MLEDIKIAWDSNDIQWAKTGIEQGKLDNNKNNTKVQKFQAEIKAKYPTISQAMGRNIRLWGNMLSWLSGNYEAIDGVEIEQE